MAFRHVKSFPKSPANYQLYSDRNFPKLRSTERSSKILDFDSCELNREKFLLKYLLFLNSFESIESSWLLKSSIFSILECFQLAQKL